MELLTAEEILRNEEIFVRAGSPGTFFSNASKDIAIEAMKVYAKQFIDLAAEKATIQIVKPHYDVRDPHEYEVNRESILDIKDLIK